MLKFQFSNLLDACKTVVSRETRRRSSRPCSSVPTEIMLLEPRVVLSGISLVITPNAGGGGLAPLANGLFGGTTVGGNATPIPIANSVPWTASGTPSVDGSVAISCQGVQLGSIAVSANQAFTYSGYISPGTVLSAQAGGGPLTAVATLRDQNGNVVSTTPLNIPLTTLNISMAQDITGLMGSVQSQIQPLVIARTNQIMSTVGSVSSLAGTMFDNAGGSMTYNDAVSQVQANLASLQAALNQLETTAINSGLPAAISADSKPSIGYNTYSADPTFPQVQTFVNSLNIANKNPTLNMDLQTDATFLNQLLATPNLTNVYQALSNSVRADVTVTWQGQTAMGMGTFEVGINGFNPISTTPALGGTITGSIETSGGQGLPKFSLELGVSDTANNELGWVAKTGVKF